MGMKFFIQKYMLTSILKLAMYDKDMEINRVNAMNVSSATKLYRNSLVLEELEALSIAGFLKQLSLEEEGRRKTEEENIKKQNADVLETIEKAVSATKARAEEKRRKEENEARERRQKLEEERRRVYNSFLYLLI